MVGPEEHIGELERANRRLLKIAFVLAGIPTLLLVVVSFMALGDSRVGPNVTTPFQEKWSAKTYLLPIPPREPQ
jgi:hypothetical protein